MYDSPNSNDITKEELITRIDRIAEHIESQRVRIEEVEQLLQQKNRQTPPEVVDKLSYGDLTGEEKLVLKYIEEHPNSTKQNLVDHFKGQMARTPVFNTIESLVKYNIVKDKLDPKNRQTHRLVINSDSVFYSVLQELNQFESSFGHLVRKITQMIMQKSNVIKDSTSNDSDIESEILILAGQPALLLDNMLRSYVTRSTMLWPRLVHDKDVLSKLTTIVFIRISNMIQRYLLTETTLDRNYFVEQIMMIRLQGTESLKGFYKTSKKYGMTNDMEPVLDALWNINKEVQEYAYPEPRLFQWDEFRYGKDNWKKLLELTEKHRDQHIFKESEEIPLDDLLRKK